MENIDERRQRRARVFSYAAPAVLATTTSLIMLLSSGARAGFQRTTLTPYVEIDGVQFGAFDQVEGLEEAGERFLNQVNATVKDWAFREVTEDLKIMYSQSRENAVALGAASLVMRRLFVQSW